MDKNSPFFRALTATTGLILLTALLCASLPAAAQGTLAALRKRGELVIATDATYPPFEYMDGKTLKGFDVEIGNAVAQELGVKARWM